MRSFMVASGVVCGVLVLSGLIQATPAEARLIDQIQHQRQLEAQYFQAAHAEAARYAEAQRDFVEQNNRLNAMVRDRFAAMNQVQELTRRLKVAPPAQRSQLQSQLNYAQGKILGLNIRIPSEKSRLDQIKSYVVQTAQRKANAEQGFRAAANLRGQLQAELAALQNLQLHQAEGRDDVVIPAAPPAPPAQKQYTYPRFGITYVVIPNGGGSFALRLTREPPAGSPMAEAGFETGDTIITLNGERLFRASDLDKYVDETSVGFINVRNNELESLNVVLPR